MKAKQLFWVVVALLVLSVVGGLGGFWLSHQMLGTRITKLQRLTGDILLENDQINRLKKLDADYRQIEPLAQKVASVLPAQKAQADVVAQIATIVRNNGLELGGLTFESTKGLPDERSQTQAGSLSGILIMPVRFQTTSSYAQLQSMLLNFEQQQRFMRVSTLEISRSDKGQLLANITLEVFLKP